MHLANCRNLTPPTDSSDEAKIYGEGEWLDQKHGIRSRRRWRKLHLGVDADTHEIVAAELIPTRLDFDTHPIALSD